MKVINYIIISLLALAASALTTHCEDQAQELSMFYSTPEAIKPGVETTFTFIFNVAMDVSENPRVSFRLPDNSVMAFKAYWDDDFSCVISCTFPGAAENAPVEITLSGARTEYNKKLSDIHGIVQFIRVQQTAPEVALYR